MSGMAKRKRKQAEEAVEEEPTVRKSGRLRTPARSPVKVEEDAREIRRKVGAGRRGNQQKTSEEDIPKDFKFPDVEKFEGEEKFFDDIKLEPKPLPSHLLSLQKKCPYCARECVDIAGHIKNHHKGKKWTGIRIPCPVPGCSKKIVDIYTHIRMVHEKVKKWKCPICEKTFFNTYLVDLHVREVHNNQKTQCTFCHQYLKPSALLAHIKRVHQGVRKRVACEVAGCQKFYSSQAELMRHVNTFHKKYRVQCQFCNKKFSEEKLSQHVRTIHEGIFPHNCTTCGKGFLFKFLLEQHQRQFHLGLFLECQLPDGTDGGICGKILTKDMGLADHIRKIHSIKDSKVFCKKCNVNVLDSYIGEHNRIVHQKGKKQCPFPNCTAEIKDNQIKKHFEDNHRELLETLEWCDECGKPCFRQSVHKAQFHTSTSSHGTEAEFQPVYGLTFRVSCERDECNFSTASPEGLERHIKQVHRSTCNKCGKKTDDLDMHNREHHSDVKTFKCGTCDKVFFTSERLRYHETNHTKELHSCISCGAQVKNLKQHIQLVHNSKDSPRLTCDIPGCNTTFASQYIKQKHVATVHEGRKKKKCHQCNKEVANLSSHVRLVHVNDRKFPCPECQNLFKTLSHLRIHVTRVHLKVREECDVCGKNVSDVLSHKQQVHLKVRNFPCDLCESSFYNSVALKAHITSIHLKQKVNCEQCNLKLSATSLKQHRKKCFPTNYIKCHLCPGLFVNTTTLNAHIDLKHNSHTKDEKL